MGIPEIILVIAVLLALVSLAEPLAQRLRLPSSVILALIGLVIGTLSTVIVAGSSGVIGEWAETIAALPVNSQVFLLIFLPALLFQGALNIDVRDMAGDAVPILAMAILAVLLSTALVGLALWPLASVPLVACLLVGAIVATTDPSAVIAIFRDLGSPQRLNRLVEGEALLNDAVAITLFVIFLDLLTSGAALDVGPTVLRVVVVPLGGAIGGFAAARLALALFALTGGNRLVQVSLTLALPYLVFVLAEHWHLSGPVGVAVAGLTLSSLGPGRVAPSAWRYLREVWDQLAFWAGSLVFIVAAILVPKLIGGFGFRDVALLAVVILAALLARGAMLFGLLPLLSALHLSPPISAAYRTVMLWGGLRGAVTLALALAVTENAAAAPEVKRFVAVLATGFVLFTLLVQGTTLRPLMRVLGLDRLTPLDAALREQALAWSQAEVAASVEKTAAAYSLAPALAHSVAEDFARDINTDPVEAIAESDRQALGLAALAAREQDLILEHLEEGTADPRLVTRLLSQARRLLEAARFGGPAGYSREAQRALNFPWRIRLANRLHFRFGIDRYLERQLATRFEMLLLNRLATNRLLHFAEGQLPALLGRSAGENVSRTLAMRHEHVVRSLDALALQYPDYAMHLERRFLRMSALRRERRGYDHLLEEGLIGPEVHRTLVHDVDLRLRAEPRPRLDFRLDTRALIANVPLFQGLGEAEGADLARLMRPAFAIPGQRLVRRGERGDSAWFIASGAVEVETGRERVRLGRGDFFGELALLTGGRRQADVTAIAYCELLVLYARDFGSFLDRHPEVRRTIEAIAAERLSSNQAAGERSARDSDSARARA